MRRAALAGHWYPSDPAECREAIERHARAGPDLEGDPRALIGPHAGWAYSGDCAGAAYRVLAARHRDAELAVVFGSHRGLEGPHTVFRGEGWETPLGAIVTERELAEALATELGLADEPVRPARFDNAVELHLPFVRHFFPRARLLMLGLGASEAALAIGRRAGELVAESGRDAVFVGSTDLTHYGPNYGFTPAGGGDPAIRWVRNENDAGFLDAVLGSDARAALAHALEHQSACCPGAVAATLEAVQACGATPAPVLVDHYLSCDVTPGASFVGYASLVL
jgi:AmmeMemoRadiSam system protein B